MPSQNNILTPTSPGTNSNVQKLNAILESDLTPKTKLNAQSEFLSKLANSANNKMEHPLPTNNMSSNTPKPLQNSTSFLETSRLFRNTSNHNLPIVASNAIAGASISTIAESGGVTTLIDNVGNIKDSIVKSILGNREPSTPDEIQDFLDSGTNNKGKGVARRNFQEWNPFNNEDNIADSPDSQSSDDFYASLFEDVKPADAHRVKITQLAHSSPLDRWKNFVAPIIVLTPPEQSSKPGLNPGVIHISDCDGRKDGVWWFEGRAPYLLFEN